MSSRGWSDLGNTYPGSSLSLCSGDFPTPPRASVTQDKTGLIRNSHSKSPGTSTSSPDSRIARMVAARCILSCDVYIPSMPLACTCLSFYAAFSFYFPAGSHGQSFWLMWEGPLGEMDHHGGRGGVDVYRCSGSQDRDGGNHDKRRESRLALCQQNEKPKYFRKKEKL